MLKNSSISALDTIESVLNKHEIKCMKENNTLKVSYSISDIYAKYEVIIEDLNEYVCIKTVFPFSVNRSVILFMSMLLAERNEFLKYSTYEMNLYSGRITLKCTFRPDGVNEKSIWTYYSSVWMIVQKDYKKLLEISEGKIPNEQWGRYQYYLSKSKEIIPQKVQTMKIPEFMKKNENIKNAEDAFDVFEFFS